MDGDEHHALLSFEEQYSGQFYDEIRIPVPVRNTSSEPSPEHLTRDDSIVNDDVAASGDSQESREPVAGLDTVDTYDTQGKGVVCDSAENLVTKPRGTGVEQVNRPSTDDTGEQLDASVAEKGHTSVAAFEIGSGDAESAEKVVLSDSEIMERYNREEEQFENEIMNVVTPLPSNRRQCRKRVLSPSPTREHVGLAHLDHLVGLMEQLVQLQEENRGLKRKCVYLEDTRFLLHLQNKQLLTSRDTRRDSRTRGLRPRTSVHSLKASKCKVKYASEDSSEEEDSLLAEGRGSRQLKMSQRSQSVGSINVIDMESSPCKAGKHEKCKESGGLEKMFSRSVLNSKWQRVKKVFGGKPEPVVKSEAYTATTEQLMRANTKHIISKHSVSRPLTSSKSYDYGVLSEPYFDEGMYTYSAAGTTVDIPPPGPGSVGGDTLIPSVVTDGDPHEGTQTPAADGGLDLEVPGGSMGSSLFSEEGEGRPAGHSPRPGSDEERRLSHQFLTVGSSMKRRQSSPTLIMQEEALKHAQKLHAPRSRSPGLTRSSSFRGENSPSSPTAYDTPQSPTYEGQAQRGLQKSERSSRSAWGRVKDIIHTRKDSLKRRNGRSHSAGDALPDGSMSDGEYILGGDYDFENWDPDSSYNSSPRKSRSRKTSAYSQPTSPERGRTNGSSQQSDKQKDPLRPTMSSPLESSAFQGSVSEEFNKKLQEWEEKKRRGTTAKGGSFSVEVEHDQEGKNKFSKEFIRKMEEWERIKGLDKSLNSSQPTAVEGRDIGSQSPTYEEIQPHQLSESFTQTVKEWERVKTQRLKDTSGSTTDISSGGGLKRVGTEKRTSRKKDRSKSSDRERDRSRSKFERQREKELQKMEKTQQKIDKEREKLGRMKRRLEQIETVSEAEVQGLSQEFAQRLREWEMKKGLLGERDESGGDGGALGMPVSPQLDSPRIARSRSYTVKHSRSNSAKQYKEKPERERTQSMGHDSLERYCQPSFPDLNSHRGSPTRSSSVPLFPLAAAEGKDECTSIDLSLTEGLHMSGVDLEKPLREELTRREEDIAIMQNEMEQLTDRINAMNQEHSAQIEHYKRELWATSRRGHYTIESDLIHASLKELQGHLEKLQSTQQQAESDNAQLQAMLALEVEAKMAAERHIIEKIGTSKESDGDQTGAEETFDRLCDFIKKLHQQLGELKLGVGERNSILGVLQEQLICQELNNRLLEVDLQRRHMEIAYLRDSHHRGVIRRTKTFAGLDYIQRGECDAFGATHGCMKASAHRLRSLEDPSDRLQYCKQPPEELRLDWLDDIVSHKHLFKGPTPTESHVTQTEPAESNADTAVQTTMSLCGKPTLGPASTPTVDQDSGGSTPIANGSAGIFPMLNPVKPVRVRHIGFGSADAPCKSDKKLQAHASDDVTYTFAIKPSPVTEKHHMWFKRPVSDGIVMETSHIVGDAPPGQEGTHFRPVTQDHSGDTEDYADSPHLPHSPVIRSHNPRKLKSNNKVTQLSADARVWKATPPKRQIRHRKGSTERRPGEQEVDDPGANLHTQQTESFIKPRTNQFVNSVVTPAAAGDRHKLTLPVQRYNRTPSPNNLTLTPVHRLKTAHELLHESENKRLSLIQNQDTPSPDSSICSTSFDIVVVSDKENSSGVFEAAKQSSSGNTPDQSPWVRQSSPTGHNVRLAVRRLSSPSREQVKPPLKDLTNDSRKLKQIKNDLIGRSSPERTVNVTAGTKISERPKGGTVSQRKEIFENKTVQSDISKLSASKQSLSSSKQTLSSSKQSLYSSKQSLTTSKQSLTSSKQSLKDDHSPDRDRKDSKSSHKSSDAKSSSSVESNANPSPGSKERKVHRLFSRKYASQSAAVSTEGEGEGAVKALCRQAVSIGLPDREDEADEASGKQGEGQEKKKGFPWLHKPKKFFKVSNDGMLQVEISDFEARIGC